MDWRYHLAFSSGSGGSRVVPYSGTLEIEEGANYKSSANYISISAMPQYKCRSHEELRFEDYELHKRPTFHSMRAQNQGNAFQQSSSLFGPCTSSAPAIQFSFGAATAAKPTFGTTSTGFGVSPSSFGGSTGIGFVDRDPKSAALGTSTTKTFGASNNSGGGLRTSTVGFSSTSLPKGPSISGSKVSTTPGFGTIPGFGIPYLPGFGIPLTPVPSFSTNGSFLSGTSSNRVSTTYGFTFGSTSASGSNGNSLSGTSSNCVSTANGFTFGSTSASGSNGSSLSGTSNNRVSNANGFTFCSTSASGSNGSSLSGTSSNCVSTTNGFTFGSTSAFGGNSVCGVKKSIGSTDKSATRLQGSRIASYSATGVVEKGEKRDSFVKLQSISAMPCYGDKGHEELRSEDYELGDKGWQMLSTHPFSFTKPSDTVSLSHSTPVTSDPWSSIANGASQPQQTVEEEDKPGPVSPFMPQEDLTSLDISSLSLRSPQDSNGDEVKDNCSSSQPDENSTRWTNDSATQLPNQHEDEVTATTERRKADVAALLPKLSDEEYYYTEPSLGELAAKEMAEAGFCSHVKDFVVGRRGYGSIKFLGETDVRHLDVQSMVQINNGEVIVYHDKKKPRVEQHLIKKAAEITLLNVKCIDKKTGKQYVEGRHVERYKEKLMSKYQEQGWEFVSYDPVEGEWKVRVLHFFEWI